MWNWQQASTVLAISLNYVTRHNFFQIFKQLSVLEWHESDCREKFQLFLSNKNNNVRLLYSSVNWRIIIGISYINEAINLQNNWKWRYVFANDAEFCMTKK